MSTTYRAVSWNPYKRRYDLVAGGLILAFLVVVLVAQATLRPELTIETLAIRALGAAAFVTVSMPACVEAAFQRNSRAVARADRGRGDAGGAGGGRGPGLLGA